MNDLSWFKDTLKNTDLINKLQKIKLIITDIDGSLTDCTIYPHEDMEETKGYSVQDWFAIVEAQKAGLEIAFLTGKTGNLIEKRAEALKIPKNLQYLGCCNNNDKPNAIEKIKQDNNLTTEEVLLFGDDFLDVQACDNVSVFACPSNSVFYVIPQADIVLPKPGGQGAFRLLLDLTLYVQNKHFAQELIEHAINN